MENFDNEIWKDIPNYEGLYQASNMGRIKSLKRKTKNQFCKTDIILKQAKTSFENKYRLVSLHKNGKSNSILVHKLVWISFVGEIPEGYEINHIDENPSNNALSNLSLVTHSENINWGTRNRQVSDKMTNGKLSKPVNQYTKEGIYIATYPSSMEVQRKLGYDNAHINKCCLGKRKSAYGYKWEYAD